MSNTLTIELPEGMSDQDAKCLWAAALFQTKKLTLGESAEAAGLTYREWVEWLQERNLTVFEYEEDYDIEAEIKLLKSGN